MFPKCSSECDIQVFCFIIEILPNIYSYYLILELYGSTTSSSKPINAGVLRGSITDPLLLKIFIFDQPTLPTSHISDFANDKTLKRNNHDQSIGSSHIQKHFFLFLNWYKEWGVKINESKSIHCTFTLRKGKFQPFTLNEQTLPTYND